MSRYTLYVQPNLVTGDMVLVCKETGKPVMLNKAKRTHDGWYVRTPEHDWQAIAKADVQIVEELPVKPHWRRR